MSEGALSDICSVVEEISSIPNVTRELDALIVAAGFEDRSFEVLRASEFSKTAHCILIHFHNSAPSNRVNFDKFRSTAHMKFEESNVHVVDVWFGKLEPVESELSDVLSSLPRSVRHIAVDISGMPGYLTCIALKAVREQRSEEKQLILYTAAGEYFPPRAQYDELINAGEDEVYIRPSAMALEMSENLILDSFKGYRSLNAKICLVVFAGHEAHRTSGIIEAVNPSLLLLIYGMPHEEDLNWRLDLSKRLHRKFEKGRRTASEVVGTQDVKEAIAQLERYYHYLIDEYDLIVCPLGSKLQTVAMYLFWERYAETQLTFAIPIGYDTSNKPMGVGSTYATTLEPRRTLFRDEVEPNDVIT